METVLCSFSGGPCRVSRGQACSKAGQQSVVQVVKEVGKVLWRRRGRRANLCAQDEAGVQSHVKMVRQVGSLLSGLWSSWTELCAEGQAGG